MAIWIHRVTAPLARRSAGRDDRLGVSAQRCGLTAGEEHAEVPAVLDGFGVGANEVAEYLLKPYLHREGGKEFFVFSVPTNADRCDFTLKFNSKAKAVSIRSFRAVVEPPK